MEEGGRTMVLITLVTEVSRWILRTWMDLICSFGSFQWKPEEKGVMEIVGRKSCDYSSHRGEQTEHD